MIKGKINPSTFPGLKPGVCSGLILSGAFDPVLKDGVWRRRSIKKAIRNDEADPRKCDAWFPVLGGPFPIENGGGGGNRTRVREPFGRASTYIACILNSPLRTPTGRIPERLSY